ncbi:DUF3106 domain-containing protein [Ottowia sp. SB7-C50]|uniref:DUF3106 domain-containing protein n=1 Tax=Ottowia sp. SB7-C50 TaxID=3081231 RepID=UPI002953A5AA|nr:DUF3106 domain-containing protein [Ottowia sp. SB7-C50]WOP14354.1 DUF3106 domain-containing protein [Ottowia sp. SB7-C50]
MRVLPPALLLALTVLVLGPAHAQDLAGSLTLAQAAGHIEWGSLNGERRAALQPLEKLWPTLSADQQRKWVALTQNYSRMSPDERSTLQSRMAEWVNLTPAQRTQARLNFGEVRKVPADEKRAKWEEYQALPAEQRERLANDRPKLPPGAAPALRPAPADRVLRPVQPPVPATAQSNAPAGDTALKVPPVNRNTLLPESLLPAASPSR